MSGRSVSISEARRRFLELIRGSAETSDWWIITKNGKPEAVLLSNEDYQSLVETVDILGAPSLVGELKRREKEIKEGDTETKTQQEVFEDTEWSLAFELWYHPAAADEIKGLESQIKSIKNSIEHPQDHPLEGNPLKGELGGFRSRRIGDYRIIYTIEHDKDLLYILYVGHRKSVYPQAKRKLS